MLNEISEKIKNEVIKIYNNYDLHFDQNKYERIVNMIIRSITSDDSIDMVTKLKLYYAGLLHPINDLDFHSFDHEIIHKIISRVNIPDYISTEEIISIIKSKPRIVYDCIKVDNTNPITILEKAKWLLSRGVPLCSYHTPYIKSRDKIYNICIPKREKNKLPSTFMKYVYHEGIFIGDDIKTTNKYLSKLLECNKESVIELCLLYGDLEHITIEDIESWVNNYSEKI